MHFSENALFSSFKYSSLSSPHHTPCPHTMNTTTIFFIAFLLTSVLSLATRPEPTRSSQPQPKPSKETGHHPTQNNNNNGGGGGSDGGIRGFFGPRGGFNVPGFGNGWGNDIVGGGYGAGYGTPTGGYSKGEIVRPTVVCKGKGPCYNKKLLCPAKCFTSYSHSGKNYGGGGGGSGCIIDCKKKCVAYC